MDKPNVLPLFLPPRQKSYRSAVAQLIRELKARHNLTNVRLSEEIGCSDETVSNAENEANDLSAVTLLRIWYEFGDEAMAPIFELVRPQHPQPKSLNDHFDDLQLHLDAVRKLLGAA